MTTVLCATIFTAALLALAPARSGALLYVTADGTMQCRFKGIEITSAHGGTVAVDDWGG